VVEEQGATPPPPEDPPAGNWFYFDICGAEPDSPTTQGKPRCICHLLVVLNSLSLVHLRRRRGQATIVEVCVVRRYRNTLWPFNHVAVSRLSPPVHSRWSCHGKVHESFALVASSLTDSQRNLFQLNATALESYKLRVPSTPLCIQAPNAPTRASDYPPESPNLRLPPNQARTPYWVRSSWPARYRSVHTLFSLVSVLWCTLEAPRPIQLS
jgi:hypothetical protein